MIKITLADNGAGIPVENLKQVFFNGFSTKPGGTGFGLHFCANAMTEMGGTIKVTSDGPGTGACFHLCLPIDRTQMHGMPEGEEMHSNAASLD